MRQNIPRLLTSGCLFERGIKSFLWKDCYLGLCNRKIILIDTVSHPKDRTPCSWHQKPTCYTHILSFTPQNNLTDPSAWRKERQREREARRNRWTQ